MAACTRPGEQAVWDAALLDGLLHQEPVLVQRPRGRLARVRGRQLVQDLQLGDELPDLCPVAVALGHLRAGAGLSPGDPSGQPGLSCSPSPAVGRAGKPGFAGTRPAWVTLEPEGLLGPWAVAHA